MNQNRDHKMEGIKIVENGRNVREQFNNIYDMKVLNKSKQKLKFVGGKKK